MAEVEWVFPGAVPNMRTCATGPRGRPRGQCTGVSHQSVSPFWSTVSKWPVDCLLGALVANLAHELQTTLHHAIEPEDRRPNGGAARPTGSYDLNHLIDPLYMFVERGGMNKEDITGGQ
jgi:hypothetical protein